VPESTKNKLCRGWEIHSCICAKNYEHGTWIHTGVIEKNKKGAVFCPTGYMLVLLQQNKSEKTACKSSHKGILKENKTMNQTKKQLVNPTEKNS